MKKPTDRIWLPEELLDEMTALANRAHPNETGGVLIGYDAGNGLAIAAITGPGPRAVHEPDAFIPDYVYQDGEIERIYRESGRCHTYLGDWHSHPDGGATLSSRDKRTLRRIARHRAARASAPIMGILASDECRGITIWKCFPRDLRAARFFARYERMVVIETKGNRTTLNGISV